MARVPEEGNIQMFKGDTGATAYSIFEVVKEVYGAPASDDFDAINTKVVASGDIEDFHPSFRPGTDNLSDIDRSSHYRGFPIRLIDCGDYQQFAVCDCPDDNVIGPYEPNHVTKVDLDHDGVTTGVVTLTYMAGTIADDFEVYYGGTRVIFVDDATNITDQTATFNKTNNTHQYAYVHVNGSSPGTGWKWTLGCPEAKTMTYEFLEIDDGNGTVEGVPDFRVEVIHDNGTTNYYETTQGSPVTIGIGGATIQVIKTVSATDETALSNISCEWVMDLAVYTGVSGSHDATPLETATASGSTENDNVGSVVKTVINSEIDNADNLFIELTLTTAVV